MSPLQQLEREPGPERGGRRSWWRPTETDLGAMVGLCRCEQGRDEPRAVRGEETGADEQSTALAARLSGVLRAGC